MRSSERNPRAPYADWSRERLLEGLIARDAECAELHSEVYELHVYREEARSQEQTLLDAQCALAESRDRYADLYDFAPLAYLTLDGHGLIREANLTASALFSRPRKQLVNCPLLQLVAVGDRALLLEHLRRCREGESPVHTSLKLRSGPAGELPVELVSHRVRELDGIVRFRTIAIDQRELLAAEVTRARAETEQRAAALRAEAARAASEAKDHFLAMLSHELRAPLTPVLLALEVLERGESDPAKLARLAMIRRNIEGQTRLVDDLLDVTRLLRQQLRLVREVCDLHELANHVLDDFEPLAREQGIALERRLQAAPQRIEADPVRIEQVIRNLLGNALKFTPRGGRVTVASDHPRPGWVRLEVSDTGRGFSGTQVERLFEPFEQLAAEPTQGLGLGLAIAKRLVEAHGGQIRAHSSGPNSGARMAFELRLDCSGSLRPSQIAAGAAAPVAGLCVLVVEDHLDSAEALRDLLELRGYRVMVARSLAEAQRRLDQHCDIVLSDLQLPDGSGYELVNQLPSDIPAVALSGFGTQADVERSRRAGFVEHLVKPISGPALFAALARATTRRDADELH